MTQENRAILFYDGDCGLCSRSVSWLMKVDRRGILFFAPIQGDTAAELLPEHLRKELSTAVYRQLQADGSAKLRLRSDAVLHAVIDIRSGWRWLAHPALWIPRSWRNWVYDRVANNRTRFFSKESCALPTAAQSKQLLA